MSCQYSVGSLALSGDDIYAARICDQPFIDYAWNSYGFNYDYWQDGWGWNDCCNVTKPLGRVFTALWLLNYSAEDWQNESWNAPMINWAPRYVREQFQRYDDLRADCGDGGSNATTSGCQWTRSFYEWKCTQWRREKHRECRTWGVFSFICVFFVTILSWFCVLWGWVSTTACTLWYWTAGGGESVTLHLPYFYTIADPVNDPRDVLARAGTLVHESRHIGGKPHNSTFPSGSAFGTGDGADESWSYDGAWKFHALYCWWFYAAGSRTSIALKQAAKNRANFIINNAFHDHPGVAVL
ncbi:hypothetical protein [Nocardioides sp.]|uniref:hypothetical protein n=1 Tax=Nocardioides sp. TaxID=35761 RepID=UPI002ED0AE1F